MYIEILLPLISSLPYPSQHEVTYVSDNRALLPELLHGVTPGICGEKEEREMKEVEPILPDTAPEKKHLTVAPQRRLGTFTLGGRRVSVKLSTSFSQQE